MTENNIDKLLNFIPLIVIAMFFYFMSRDDLSAKKTPHAQHHNIRDILIGIIITVVGGLILYWLTKP